MRAGACREAHAARHERLAGAGDAEVTERKWFARRPATRERLAAARRARLVADGGGLENR